MNIFLVYSPFQLIGVLEAINHFNYSKTNFTIIYLSKDPKNIELTLDWFFKLLPFEVQFNCVLHSRSIKSWMHKMKLLRNLSQINIDTLYIGDLREDTMKLFVSNLNFSHLFHLDDGASTLNIRDLLKENPLTLLVSSNSIKRTIFKMFNFSLYKRVQLNWFTIFDLLPVGNEVVINHDFRFLKSAIIQDKLSSVNSHCLYFIGSNLINAGVVSSPDDYLQLLTKTFTKISSSKIKYLLHRHEDVLILESLKKYFDIEFISFNEPIEITFSKNNLNNCVLASFYSTALFTLNKLVNCEMLMVNIPEIYLSSVHSANTLNVQRYYSSIFKSISI